MRWHRDRSRAAEDAEGSPVNAVVSLKVRVQSAAVVLALLAATASAPVFSGNLDDAANAALFGSEAAAPSFARKLAIAHHVVLLDLAVPTAGTVTITSSGVASGGADPSFSMVEGADATATFLASNYDQAFSTGGDFGSPAFLAAGAYRLAIGVFANL